MIQNYEALTSAGQEATGAVTKFHKALAGGIQEIAQHIISLAQSAVETNLEISKAAMEVKSAQELAKLHADWTHRLFNTALSGSAKLSEITSKVASEAATPLHTTIGKMAGNIVSFSNKAA